MNSCPHSKEVIDYLLLRLTEEHSKAFEAHLGSCSVCQKELELEKAIDGELMSELNPGMVEQRIIRSLGVYATGDSRSFWLYAYRTAVLGVAAAIACFLLLPYLLRFPVNFLPALGKLVAGIAGSSGGSAAIDPVYLFIGFGYFMIAAGSIYAYAQSRR